MTMPGWRSLACCLVLACVPTAHGHLVYGTKTLHGFVSESDLVLRARIVTAYDSPSPSADHPAASRPGVEADVLELLKGSLDQPRVKFAQHGHGVLQFEPGDETLLFLVGISASRELDELGQTGTYEWVSLQEHDDEYALNGSSNKPVLDAVRAYVAGDAAISAEVRIEALRRATQGLLTSGDTRLAASAVRDLVLAPTLPLVTQADVPALESVLNNSDTSMGLRVGLLAELERRGLVDGPALLLSLLSPDVPQRDRITAIRGAGASSSKAVRARLVALLKDPDVSVAAAAATALGARGDDTAVVSLTEALMHDSPEVRMGAIRGLGRITSPRARVALEHAASSHPDPATQRRARAEVRKRGDEASVR